MSAGRIRSHWRKSVADRAGLPLEHAITVMPAREAIKGPRALVAMIHTDRSSMPRGLDHRSDLTVQVLIIVRKGRTSVAQIIAMPDHKATTDRRTLAVAIHTDRNSMPRGLGRHSDLTVQVLITVRKGRTSGARIIAMPDHKATTDRRALAAVIHTDRDSMPRGLGHHSGVMVRGLIDITKDRSITQHRIVHRQVVRHMVEECLVTVPQDVMHSHRIVRVRAGRIAPGRAPVLVTVTPRLTLAVVPVGRADTGLVHRVRTGLAEERHRVDHAKVGFYRRSKVLMRALPWGCLSMRTRTERSARTRC